MTDETDLWTAQYAPDVPRVRTDLVDSHDMDVEPVHSTGVTVLRPLSRGRAVIVLAASVNQPGGGPFNHWWGLDMSRACGIAAQLIEGLISAGIPERTVRAQVEANIGVLRQVMDRRT